MINNTFINSDPSFNFTQHKILIKVSSTVNVTPLQSVIPEEFTTLINPIRTISFVLALLKATGTTPQHFSLTNEMKSSDILE